MIYFLQYILSLFTVPKSDKKQLLSPTFELYKDTAGQYRFRLKAANSEIILASEGYTTKASAKKGIASVKKNAQHSGRYQRKKARNNQYFFNLKAANHEVIGTSETYTSSSNRDNGIERVKAIAPCAVVVDLV